MEGKRKLGGWLIKGALFCGVIAVAVFLIQFYTSGAYAKVTLPGVETIVANNSVYDPFVIL